MNIVSLTLLQSERLKLHRVLAVLSAIGLRKPLLTWLLSLMIHVHTVLIHVIIRFLAHLYQGTGRAIALSPTLAAALVVALASFEVLR